MGETENFHKRSMYSADSPENKDENKDSTISPKTADIDTSALKIKTPINKRSENTKESPRKIKNASTIDYGSGIIAPNYV